MDEDERDLEIDWGKLRSTQMDLAEMVWSYHAALINAGFEKGDALGLTMAYQQMIIAQGED